MENLESQLCYTPRELRFGTSGRRGPVAELAQLEIFINAVAELEYLQSLPPAEGGILPGEVFYYAYDLRPSSTRYLPEEGGCGEIAQAIESALRHCRMLPVNCGRIPTPALAFHAWQEGKGGIMVTGSHIPYDRNGYKTNSARGELLKEEEPAIQERVAEVRRRVYGQPFSDSPFDAHGRLRGGPRGLAPENLAAQNNYLRRYSDFFGHRSLQGLRLLCWQHSAVGRDMLVEILRRLGAEVEPIGRSESFIPVDTENMDDSSLAAIQVLVDDRQGTFDAVVSTDGDSDRPLLLGIDKDSRQVRFFGGDLIGMLVAEFLEADAVVVPISCNDAIDRSRLRLALEPKTRIGSPYVIVGMRQALARGKQRVCGWEANGGFLLGSAIREAGKTLQALPTRDAFLPLLGVLFSAVEKRQTIGELFSGLPRRFGRASLRPQFARSLGRRILDRFTPNETRDPQRVQADLASFFPSEMGFGRIAHLDYTDGLRISFSNGEIAHLRPSGNADEFRVYAVADTQARAEAIAKYGIAEPDGILRRLTDSVYGEEELCSSATSGA